MSNKPATRLEDGFPPKGLAERSGHAEKSPSGDGALADRLVDADDLLIGAAEIAEFVFGSRDRRRSVYYFARKSKLPIFKYKTQLRTRKSTLRAWLEEQERLGWGEAPSGPPSRVKKQDSSKKRPQAS
jgi:hypothetical protein